MKWPTSVSELLLYIYVGNINGGMYKIGTGEKDTVAGKVYLYSPINKSTEVVNYAITKGFDTYV